MIVSMSCCFGDEDLAENMEERTIEDICEFCKYPRRYVISFSLKITAYQLYLSNNNLLIWKEKIVLNNSISEKKKQKYWDELEHVKKCSIKRVNERADED